MRSIDLAEKYLGKQETEGPNDGPILRSIRDAMIFPGAPPCSWCAIFVGWILCRAYAPERVPPKGYRNWLQVALQFYGAWYPESCQSWLAEAQGERATTKLVPRGEAGDLFVLLNHEGVAHHIGFVTGWLPENEFGTLEGNTNSGGSFNGDGVYRRLRIADNSVRFIQLPNYLKG